MIPMLSERWPVATAVCLAVLQLGAALVFLAIALIVNDWRPAVVTVVGLIAAGWNLRTAVRVRAAQGRGAVTLPNTLDGGSAHGPSPGEAYKARLHRGSQVRDGILFVVDDVSAFVPTGGWIGQGTWALLRGAGAWLLRTTVAQIPEDAEQLLHNVEVQDGLAIGVGWEWSPGRGALVDPGSGDQLIVSMPARAKLRWPLKRERLRARRNARLAVAAGGVVSASCMALGGVAWAWTGDVNYFVAGLAWGGLFLLAPVLALLIILKQHPIESSGG